MTKTIILRPLKATNLTILLLCLITVLTFQNTLAQKQPVSEENNTKTEIITDSLRREELTNTMLSYLQKIPADSIRPYTKNGFFQAIITLRIRNKNSEEEELLMVDSESQFINSNFRDDLISNENLTYLFTTKEPEDKIAGPYLLTYFLNADGIISKTTRKQRDKEPDLITYRDIGEPPVFPGCGEMSRSIEDKKLCFQQKVKNHIAKNFKYPKESMAMGHQDNVSVFFTITQNGKVVINKTKGRHPLLVEEAERIIRLLPHFTPGSYKGLNVDTDFTIPFKFRLNQ